MVHSPVACLKKAELFQDLPDDLAQKLATVSIHQQHFPKGSLIRQPFDGQNGMFAIDQGAAKVYSIAESGKESVLDILKKGDIEGQQYLFKEEDSENYIQALEDTWICSMSRHDFQELLKSSPELSLNLLNNFGEKLVAIEKNSIRRNSLDAKSRILAYFEDQAKKNGSRTIELSIKKKDLASYLGVTPETLSRQMKKLVAEDIIQLSGKKVHLL